MDYVRFSRNIRVVLCVGNAHEHHKSDGGVKWTHDGAKIGGKRERRCIAQNKIFREHSVDI